MLNTDKIVFFDLDGTLLDENKEILASTKDAIRSLQEKGIYTALATGRTPNSFDWILRETNIDTYVSINGQYVVFESNELFSDSLPMAMLREIDQLTRDNGHALAYCSHKGITVNQPNHPLIWDGFKAWKANYPAYDPNFHEHSAVHQLGLFCSNDEKLLYADRFADYSFIQWRATAWDVLPKHASKASGIAKLLDKMGFKAENCYAFGDGLNDIEMFKYVGTAVAMGNADDEVKQVADMITSSNAEDGIRNGLVQLGLL
ncbi:Cof-type HAD-IIB family hydrolase [Paenibacillus albus]|uniref:Cof-type HAD-IIB family hydrolase n=1 Tax=Paenibacillus albus TaxID=2495582 RepID=A0A3Q8X8Q8_9BACL|nr:Cof-type HAD-IIB family hydrolase [Paenibacillus albus]AZN43114.1 Cof-type HAD-IIB family hydrolase [Paenibacillus albus]